MNLNEIANEFPDSNKVQFSGTDSLKYIKSEILSPTGLSGKKN